tara:strand:- start:1659 stop:1835 length:177 start_codon:yes stop_codon:yes gene_type:complete
MMRLNKGKKFGAPPEKGPQPQGMVFGGMGCPHREMGAKSDIQGVKDIQVKGKSFKGVK